MYQNHGLQSLLNVTKNQKKNLFDVFINKRIFKNLIIFEKKNKKQM